MNLVTDGMLIVSGSAATLGAIHLRMCFQKRDRLTHIIFTVASFGLACYALFERALMQAASPAEHLQLMRWAHIFVWLVVVPTAWFVHLYLNAGRRWVLWCLTLFRTLALIANFASAGNLNYHEVTSLDHVNILGEPLSVAVGIANPWMLLGQISLLFFMLFSVDAIIEVWRRGDRRRALTVGASLFIFSLTGLGMAVFILWGIVALPLFSSPFFLGIIIAMGYEISRDVQRAGQLSDDLTASRSELNENQRQMALSASAANVGIWTRLIGEETIQASEKWHELFEFDLEEKITFRDYLQRIYPADRERVANALIDAEKRIGEYETEYRVLLRSGEIRWIGSRGKIDFEDGIPVRLRGASVDITKRKLAEEAAHDLSGRMFGAQESERARIARELHDDFSQSLALLSIQLEVLGRESAEPAAVKKKVTDLTAQIQGLSSDVHRISHELHPSKLGQLGLEAALRGFCREITAAHRLKVAFDAENVPRSLSNDISLCLYRVTQESLQNIQKHSGASLATVKIDVAGDEVRLVVSDNGCGFNPENETGKESLGLISMSERVRYLNGTLSIESRESAGTKITVSIPLKGTSERTN
ncbi:MAG TPA: histidine kinase [Pyrinomonadaceae bacterium]|nr:histidine kinase [Pyrinomonadaceae bacterium]